MVVAAVMLCCVNIVHSQYRTIVRSSLLGTHRTLLLKYSLSTEVNKGPRERLIVKNYMIIFSVTHRLVQ
jgi:hypothetical protein